MGKLIFVPSNIPSLKSEMMQRLAKHFWELKRYYHDARFELEQKWRMCDEAYLCYRWLPDTGAIDFLDDSEFGETDAYDNVNTIVIRMLQTILPPGAPYLNPAAVDPEEPWHTTDAIRDFLLFKHRESGTRRQLAKWLKMMAIRGDGAFYWEHLQEYEYRRVVGPREAAAIQDALATGGIASREAAKFTQVMEKICKVNGPSIRTIDTHDYFFSPITDLTNKRKEPFIVQTYRYIEDLQNEEDEKGNKVYENLEGLEGSYAHDLFGRMNDGVARVRSLEIMGIQPEADRGGVRLVPVYITYCPYIKFEGKVFYDTYFHIAINGGGKLNRGGARMIRVEKNPTGQRQFLFDTYNEFCTNVPYGIGAIEKSLTALRQKNVLGALMFNAAVASQFPAMNVLANAYKDGEVSFMPGGLNEVDGMMDVTKVMAPVPTPDKGLQLAWQDMKFWGDEIRGKMGIDGLQPSNPTRSITKSKTATEVTHDASSGNLFLDEMAAKYADTLTTFFQGSFDVMKDRIEPDEQGYLEYQRNIAGRVVTDQLSARDFQKPRSITIGYLQGIFDKGQRLEAITQIMQMAAQNAPFLPNAAGIVNDLFMEAARLANVPIKPQSLMSPEQLAAENPQIQVMAIQSALQQIGQAQQQGKLIPPSLMGGGGEGDITDAEEIS